MADFRKTLTAPDGQRRAVILRHPDGRFQVDFERWDDTQVTGVGGLSDPFWRFEGEEAYADTLEAAESLAETWISAPAP